VSTSFQSKIPNSLNEHWMPFSSNKDFKKNPRIIVKAEGIHLHTHDGKTLIDGSSGLYCNPLGHGRKEIIEAIKNQLENLDYTMPFQQGYGGSFELATMIAQKTPEDLNRIFYTICGSTAVETAIKIAPLYSNGVCHVTDASKAVTVASKLISKNKCRPFIEELNREYSNLRTSYFKKDNKKENSIEKCRKNKFKFDWKSYKPHAPKLLGLKTDYKISVEKIEKSIKMLIKILDCLTRRLSQIQ